MCSAVQSIFRVFVLFIACCSAHIIAADEDEARQALGMMAEGYLSNRESFTSFTCRFTVTNFTAASIAHAKQGKFTEKGISYEGIWLVDGPNVRYQLICDPVVYEKAVKDIPRQIEALKAKGVLKKGKMLEVSMPCSNSDHLKSKSFVACQDKLLHGASLYPADTPDPPGLVRTPFNLGLFDENEGSSPGRKFRLCLDGKCDGTFEGTQQIDGVDVLVATTAPKGSTPTSKYYLDPNRGFLPIHFWQLTPEIKKRWHETWITDIRKCSGER